MPIIISGYLTVSVPDLRAHIAADGSHRLSAREDSAGRHTLYCDDCLNIIAKEPAPRTDLYCGCTDQAMHDQGAATIAKWRKQYRIPKSSCVGCYMGDDGIPFHECAVHG